jgi:hypothetical protein
MFLILLIVYSAAISAYLFRLKRQTNKPHNDELATIWHRITAKPDPTAEDIKAIAEVAKARQTEIPWYEKSLSTIGIVAFFSMLIATSFQTINSAKAEIEASNLRQEIKELEAQRETWNRLVKDLAQVAILKSASGKLEPSEEAVLRQRLSHLDKIDKPDSEDQVEQLKLLLALKEYDLSAALVEKSKVLRDETSPETLLFLAEMAFVDGARARAKGLLKRFESNLSNQPADWQLRFYVLQATLDADPKAYVESVASLKHISLDDAYQLLYSRIGELKAAEKRRGRSLEN